MSKILTDLTYLDLLTSCPHGFAPITMFLCSSCQSEGQNQNEICQLSVALPVLCLAGGAKGGQTNGFLFCIFERLSLFFSKPLLAKN